MNTTPLAILGLAVIAFTFTGNGSEHLKGSQKFFGVIAVVCTMLILLQPEFLALGLFGDAAFFDLLVLALSLQMHSYAVLVIRLLAAALSRSVRWFGIPSPGFSYLLGMLALGSVDGLSALQRIANRLGRT